MAEYFVDAWLIIAALDPTDSHHRQARRIASRLAQADLVTHDGVFSEVMAFFSGGGARMRALAVDTLRNSRFRWTVLPVDRELFDRAVDLYEERPDKQYSLIDCMSMLVMQDRGITHVLTNDHHFRQEGFTVLSDAP
jgi:uncharacterized protein